MPKGLSPLQKRILRILEDLARPRLKRAKTKWMLPHEIRRALRLSPTLNNRSALAHSLRSLCLRGLVVRARGRNARVGNPFRYSRTRRHGSGDTTGKAARRAALSRAR